MMLTPPDGVIFHITTRAAWERSMTHYTPEGYEDFIHASTREQIDKVARVFFKGQKDLVLLHIDPALLEPELRWEPGLPALDPLFPHIYGPLNVTAVTKVTAFSAPG